jgi:hypothetical protein
MQPTHPHTLLSIHALTFPYHSHTIPSQHNEPVHDKSQVSAKPVKPKKKTKRLYTSISIRSPRTPHRTKTNETKTPMMQIKHACFLLCCNETKQYNKRNALRGHGDERAAAEYDKAKLSTEMEFVRPLSNEQVGPQMFFLFPSFHAFRFPLFSFVHNDWFAGSNDLPCRKRPRR